MTEIKKVLFWLAVVLGIVVAADVIFGVAMNKYISSCQLKGDYRSVDYILRNSDDEIMVLGSSVALNSINTATLQDSLGIKTYNGGSNGQTIPYYQTLLEIIAERPKLKTVIIGLVENNLSDIGLGERYRFLVPYYGRGFMPVDKRLEGMSKTEKIFLKSSLYKFNTVWFRMMLYNFVEPGIKGENGFIAKDIPPIFPKKDIIDRNIVMSAERATQLEQMSELCRRKNIRLILCLPPRYEERRITTDVERQLRQRAMRGDFELWFDASCTPLSNDSTMFYDATHLNISGSKIYTDTVLQRLKKQR